MYTETTAHPTRSMQHHRLFCLAIALAAALLALPASADPWLHLEVESRDHERVTVNLPISLMRAAVEMIPNDVHSDIRVEFEDIDLEWDELRDFWNEVKAAPEMTFVTIETRDEHVAVRKEGDMVIVRTLERSAHGAEVDMQLPTRVIDALLSGPDGRFDFGAALDALVDYGPGQLMTVKDGEDRVRIWIDDEPEAGR